MEELQMIAFEMISIVGEAKAFYMDAVNLARENEMEEAKAAIHKGNEVFKAAHGKHFECIQKEASGEQLPFSILFMHSEDQLLSTETMREMAVQLVTVYEEMNKLKEGK